MGRRFIIEEIEEASDGEGCFVTITKILITITLLYVAISILSGK